MRILAALLLLLNLGWFAWQQGLLPLGEVARPLVRTPFQQAPQRLLMVSELPPGQRALMEEIAESRQRSAEAEARMAEVVQEIAVTQEQLPAQASQGLPETTPWCAIIGPFTESDAAEDWLAGLVEVGGEGIVEERDEPVSSTWWVHTLPLPGEPEARLLLAELQSKGIDSYYLRDGQLAGGISLGVFSRQESARLAQEQLGRQGYRAEITQIFRNGQRYYIDMRLPDSGLLETPQWLTLSGGVSTLQPTEKTCEVIARQNQFP